MLKKQPIPETLEDIFTDLNIELEELVRKVMHACQLTELQGSNFKIKIYPGYPPMIIEGPKTIKGWMRFPSLKENLEILTTLMFALKTKRKQKLDEDKNI